MNRFLRTKGISREVIKTCDSAQFQPIFRHTPSRAFVKLLCFKFWIINQQLFIIGDIQYLHVTPKYRVSNQVRANLLMT